MIFPLIKYGSHNGFQAWSGTFIIALMSFLALNLSSCSGNSTSGNSNTAGISTEKIKKISLRSPVRLMLNPDGTILVSDYFRKRIYVLDSLNLEVIKSFAVSGRPRAVASGKFLIYVGNESTDKVDVYSNDGYYIYSLAGNVTIPSDIAIDAGRNLLFVADSGERNIKVFDLTRPFQGPDIITGTGSDPELIINPRGIAIDENSQEIFVTDFGNASDTDEIPARLKVYNYAGSYLGGFSADDVANSYKFASPQGVAVSDNYIFMVESVLGKILVFNRSTFAGVKTIGSFGSDPGQLSLPLDIIIDPATNNIFVTNNRLRRVEVFLGGGLMP